MHIAVFHPDPLLLTQVCATLTTAGYFCRSFQNSSNMLSALDKEPSDLVIVHGANPASDSAMLITEIKKIIDANAPILLMTSPSHQEYIVKAINAGADDYLITPLRRGELLTRVRILLQRRYPEGATLDHFQFETYVFDIRAHRIEKQGCTLDVTQKEFLLALLFFRHIGRPLSRAYIMETIWSREADVPTRTVDTHASRVRNKLGLQPENGFRLIPVYSYGYLLEKIMPRQSVQKDE